jgi:hypothetical protein
MTVRDEVWAAVLEELVRTGRFKISDLEFEESERHTVRRVLKQMEKFGWLSRKSDKAAIWRIGERAELYLNVSPTHIEKAHSLPPNCN